MDEIDEIPPGGRWRPIVMLVLFCVGPLIASATLIALIAWHADPTRGVETPHAWPRALRRAVVIGCLTLSILPPAAFGLLCRETWPVRVALAVVFGVGGAIFTFCAGFAAFSWLDP